MPDRERLPGNRAKSSQEKTAPDKSTVTAPTISLPKGGGAIRGIGEKFDANPVTGTGSMSVPIATSPGRSGFGPQLSLSYDSGAGNGLFGFGWSLSLPSITRKTDKGLPQYRDAEESDVFILSGAEDLVPVLVDTNSNWERKPFDSPPSEPGYTIQRYRPRIEGLFARIERWTDKQTGISHWRSISKDNITTLYGKREDARIADPADPAHIFSWLICESYDDKGNAILYEYKSEDDQNYEITKPISLRQINPLALLQLKETGTCEFTLPEVLFDMDHPGHYMRRIKSVALTIPCIVGPYTSLNCTLRLLGHKFRTSAIAKNTNDYLEKTEEPDERFSTVNVPITAIAVSTGQNDSGVFELNFRDERYIPFEGAGAISKWRIELPAQFRQFDYDSITDVIMQVRYTAIDGGDKLKKPAADSVQEYIKSVEELSRQEGLFAAFDLKHDFPNEWYQATQPPAAGATERLLTLSNLYDTAAHFHQRAAAKQDSSYGCVCVYPRDPAGLRPAADPGQRRVYIHRWTARGNAEIVRAKRH